MVDVADTSGSVRVVDVLGHDADPMSEPAASARSCSGTGTSGAPGTGTVATPDTDSAALLASFGPREGSLLKVHVAGILY